MNDYSNVGSDLQELMRERGLPGEVVGTKFVSVQHSPRRVMWITVQLPPMPYWQAEGATEAIHRVKNKVLDARYWSRLACDGSQFFLTVVRSPESVPDAAA